MCLVASLKVEKAPTAARAARAWPSEQLKRWELDQLTERAALLISELVTNAVKHAESAPVVTIAVAQGYLEIGCSDGKLGESLESLYEITQGETLGLGGAIRDNGGLGLRIVDVVADAWGQREIDAGKQVWCRISVED
jgi:anti-sigma regulatory factor (Ser/Thr protein kinase)